MWESPDFCLSERVHRVLFVVWPAWTNALEIASIEVDIPRSCLILSTGVAERSVFMLPFSCSPSPPCPLRKMKIEITRLLLGKVLDQLGQEKLFCSGIRFVQRMSVHFII